MIYLASNYSHPDAAVRNARYVETLAVTTTLLAGGVACFSPIVYGHQMEDKIGTDYKSWKIFNDAMVRACRQFWVLQLADWERSQGIAYEIAFAQYLDKPIKFIRSAQDYLNASR